MYENFLNVINQLVPYVEKRNVPVRNEWLDDNAFQLIKKRDDLRLRLTYFKNDEKLFSQFKDARNKARQAVIEAKASSVKTLLANNFNNPKKFWVNLKKLMPGKKDLNKSSKTIVLKDENRLILEDNLKTANHANIFFIRVGPDLAAKIPAVNRDLYYDALTLIEEDNNKISNFPIITEKGAEGILKAIDTNKSSNIKDIDNKLFKDCLLSTVHQVCYLYNLVISTCSIPESWKQALVVPLYKDGDSFSVANYRPISMLPQIVKCFEKILHSMILNHVIENNIMQRTRWIPTCNLRSTSGVYTWPFIIHPLH